MEKIEITTEFIKLDQFLKWVGIVTNGNEAKYIIKDGLVRVNGEIEIRRGKKLRKNDIVEFEEERYLIV